MDGAELLRKLQIKSGARLRLIGAPSAFEAALGRGVAIAGLGEPYDAALAFCETPADVALHSKAALGDLPGDGILWFAYRKGPAAKASGLNRDVGWAPLADAGYRGVRSISLDETWTGLRFRETAKVKSKP